MYHKYARMYLHPNLYSGLAKIRAAVYRKVGTLDAEYISAPEPIPFEQRAAQPLKPIKKGEKWGRLFDCGWFHFTGTVPECAKGQNVKLVINVDGEGCLFDDEGTPVRGISVVCGVIDYFTIKKGKTVLDFTDCAEGNDKIDIWVETGHNKLTTNIKKYAVLKQADIAVYREDIKDLYYDYLTLLIQMSALKKNHTKFISIRNTLSIVINQLNGLTPEDVEVASRTLKMELQFGERMAFKYYAVGHSHLDLAWLWPIRETKRKMGRTLANTVTNLEKYPAYVYGISQPQQLAWAKELYPKLHDKIKDYIDQDRIEVQGKMWVECDTNVSGGESLVRQSVYGERFWLDEYGKTSKICWLPDVFGFTGNLPQILKKSGMEYFLTIKLSWNEHNKFPHRTFIWEGIDDSSVLVHMPPEGNYNSDASPISLFKGLKQYPEKNDIHIMGLLYGIGDGGGGPGEGHIECALRERVVSEMPTVSMSPASKLFNELEGFRKVIKTHKGELYLEKHQGTLTSQAKNKMYNRLSERKFHEVELLSTIAAISGGYEYPYDELETLWKEVLLYQFHDILPGSSIKRVYDESVPRYQAICARLDELKALALDAIKGKETLSAVNTTGFERDEYIEVDGKVYRFNAKPYSSAALAEEQPEALSGMENEYYKLSFGKNGEIVSMFDKVLGKEMSGKGMNFLNVYPDPPSHYEAWDINIKYTKKKPKAFKLMSFKVYAQNNSIIRENLYAFGKSSLTQKVILTKGDKLVRFETTVDWQETRKMLRAEFKPSVFAPEATFDIQFGSIKRSTRNVTSIEKAQFEVCGQKYVDVSDNGMGISLINDCKYGHRVKDGLISLNLLRSPMKPAKDADKGIQTFSYALYSHEGDFTNGVAKNAYFFNYPIIIANKSFDSFVSADDEHVVIETVKMAESREKEIIIRAYEDTGTERTAEIKVGTSYEKAVETDLLENETGEIDLKAVTFKPYEIKTFKLKL